MKSKVALGLLSIAILLLAALPVQTSAGPEPGRAIVGPLVGEPVMPVVFDGDLRDLPQVEEGAAVTGAMPLRPLLPGEPPEAPPTWLDPLVQKEGVPGQMPAPLSSFPGVDRADGGFIPPDTNGDVGPSHYVQTVNVRIGIYDKATGAELVNTSFDSFFTGTGTVCDYSNRGDVIVLYDPLADRWLITDFAWLGNDGPYYQCLAVSQTGDPVAGGWTFYALHVDVDSLHDYPKFGVWPDGYYMSANMFGPHGWEGARVWALDRASMLSGGALNWVSFELGPSFGSLLPANVRGAAPPAGSPNYFASIEFPNQFQIWEFHADWATPANSTFTGPTVLTVADYGFVSGIPQQAPGEVLDSLGDRLMMQLQYRNFGSYEALWANHTVASGGGAGIRWYEIRDPGGAPTIHQQGTYQPDENYRWMGSLAVDQDGNMALGYSVSSASIKPEIRYAGRLAGEPPGLLPQGETTLIASSGVQVFGSGRWGDYSAMTVDPVDDCTFWYTQEYYESTGALWKTRIGSFRFPSCGQPKGWIAGTVYNADTLEGVGGAQVVAVSAAMTLTVPADASGHYSMTLPADTYTLTAGPLLPGYPDPAAVAGVAVAVGATTPQDLPLTPRPRLAGDALALDDGVAGGNGNGNGYPEPGESGVQVWESLGNTGATTATNVSAHLTALTPGVAVTAADVGYPDIAAGDVETNLPPFELSIAPEVACGARLQFEEVVTADQGVYTITFSLDARVPLPVQTLLADDVEGGPGGWTTGGAGKSWTISEETAHSPTHAWSDSALGNYLDSSDTWLRSPVLDLSGKSGASLSFWHRYDLETGWDYGYVEYSTNGGADWEPQVGYTGAQGSWTQVTLDASALDDQPEAVFRFRLDSDEYVTADGWYMDDVALSYQPYTCFYPNYLYFLPLVPTAP